MKRSIALVLIAALVALVSAVGPALGSETTFVGVVEKIEVSGAQAKVVLKDVKTDEDVTVIVKDDLTLEKFKDHRIVEGDEIRVKYQVSGDEKVATYFRKTAGC